MSEIYFYIREETTYGLLWLVKKMNRHKDRVLAYHLRNMAEDYEPRPRPMEYRR